MLDRILFYGTLTGISIIIIGMVVVMAKSGEEYRELNEPIVERYEYREYRLAGINKPKHFSVDLIDLDSLHLFKDVGRSKHCNVYRKWSVGQTVRLKTMFFRTKADDTLRFKPVEVNEYFCGGG